MNKITIILTLLSGGVVAPLVYLGMAFWEFDPIHPVGIRWRIFTAFYYVKALIFYLIFGIYLLCLYPRASWAYLRAVAPSWELIKKGIDIVWAKFLDKFFPADK